MEGKQGSLKLRFVVLGTLPVCPTHNSKGLPDVGLYAVTRFRIIAQVFVPSVEAQVWCTFPVLANSIGETLDLKV